MPAAFVRGKQTGSAATASLAITKPTAGNLLVAFVSQLATKEAPSLAGWTLVEAGNHALFSASANSLYAIYKTAAGTEESIAPTAGAGGSVQGISYIEVSGAGAPIVSQVKNNGASAKTGAALAEGPVGCVLYTGVTFNGASGGNSAWTGEGEAPILNLVEAATSRMDGGYFAVGSALTAHNTFANWTTAREYCVLALEIPEASTGVTIPLAAASSTSAASLGLTAAPTVPLVAAASSSAASLGLTAGPLLPLVAAGSLSAAALALTAAPTVPLAGAVSASAASLGVTAGPTLPLVAAGAVSAAALGLTAGAGRIPLAPALSSSATSLALGTGARLLLESASSTSGATLVLRTGHVAGESFSAGGFPSGDAAGGVSAGRPGAGGSSSLAWGAAGGSAAAGSAGAGGSVGRMFSTGGGS